MPHYVNMTSLFRPESVAVVGASAASGKVGRIVTANLLAGGYRGKIFPVNPHCREILGLEVVPNVSQLPLGVDLAVVCVPPSAAVEVMEGLGQRRAKACIMITGGYTENGAQGHLRQKRIIQLAEQYRMALLGPSSLGVLNTAIGLNATFARGPMPRRGNIAFFSQSGAVCAGMLEWAESRGAGFSSLINLGVKALLSENEILDYLQDDPETEVILGYLESFSDGAAFLRAADLACRKKPVLLIKGGYSAAGAKAASSHTGALPGSRRAYRAAFGQCGVIEAQSMEELFELGMCFSSQPTPSGPNLAVLTNSGGPGILAADAAEAAGLSMPYPGKTAVDGLRQIIPPSGGFYNPVDIMADADVDRMIGALRLLLADERMQIALVIITPSAKLSSTDAAQALIRAAKDSHKPVLACLLGESNVQEGRRLLTAAGVPCFGFAEPAVRAAGRMWERRRMLDRPWAAEVCFRQDLGKATQVIAQAREQGLNVLPEFLSQDFARAYELSVPQTILARTSDEAVQAASKIGYPVALKLASPQVAHKSDLGGVALNLADPDSVRRTFLDITSRITRAGSDIHVTGCMVQAMAPPDAKEVIMGFQRDEQFGPMLMFGLGGVYIETLRDVSFRLAPLTLQDAAEMIREIRSYPLLKGVRGEQPVDFKSLEDVLLTLSQIAMDFPEIMEVEINPVLVSQSSALAVDMRISLDSERKITQQAQSGT
jgi:acetyltransferase